MCSEDIIDLYERHAHDFDRDRARSLQEQEWLDRFLDLVPPGGIVLDLGCGTGEPLAAYLMQRGCGVVGVDSSPTLIGMCRERFPGSTWIVGDMRTMDLGRRFAGLMAWDSLFHLTAHDQRGMFARFAAHALPGAPLLFTSGRAEGESIGSYRGAPLFHASLGPPEYERLLASHGFSVQDHKADDPRCGGHTVWLARLRSEGRPDGAWQGGTG